MNFHPRFSYSHAMVRHLGLIESARAVISVLPLPPDQELRLRQTARQRATRHSTRIEGNTLNSQEVGRAVIAVGKTQTEMQQEVRNYWRALEWIEEQLEANRQPSEEYIRELHSIILVRGTGRRGVRSDYRKDECPVVDSATGRIDYAPPMPRDVPVLMRDLVKWWRSDEAAELPGPARAGLLAHRFVSIHPFGDGNGRTARALATTELWRSGYDMRGFLSLEEHYTADLNAYYDNLQMRLPVNFYDGRHDPDHSQWLGYFLATMAQAADSLHQQAIALHAPEQRPAPPWESLRRVQQQLLNRLLFRGVEEGETAMIFSPGDMVEWFGISPNTARDWLAKWREENFVQPLRPEAARVRAYALTEKWETLVKMALNNATRNTS
ncbi:MAG: Fic family protein [Thiobacillus sp.]|uniref:Fic family protein n=1 Tax=Thiobacillus sp. TaxID=924 RepID=UPI002895B988|nr:Fic family protein [Thiobacillus sp.]MDT3706018.1 Fic family protein [Thiobacillus sp.]